MKLNPHTLGDAGTQASPGAASEADPQRRLLLAGLLAAGVCPAALAQPTELPAGQYVARDTPDYELWRRSMMWQYRKSARYPGIIVQARSVADVVSTVRYARRQGLRVATRAGGHSMSACFLRDNGILLDVSRLDGIDVQAAQQRVSIGPGVLGRALNERLRPHGLAFPTAHCGMVSLSGFLLGGGVGWNGNAWGGMSVFNVLGADVVTADGVLRQVDARRDADLFWALRGGGPGLFGVVTRLHLQCHALPRAIRSWEVGFKVSDLPAVAAALAELGPKMSRDVELLTVIEKARDEHPALRSEGDGGQAVYVNVIAFTQREDEAVQKAAPLLTHPIMARAVFQVGPVQETFETLYTGNELPFPQKRWQADNMFTNRPVEAVSLIQQHLPACPTQGNAIVLLYKGLQPRTDAACSTGGDFYLSYYMVWERPEDDLVQRDYLRTFFEAAAPLAAGSYINEFNQEGRPKDLRQCYTDAAWERLQALRLRWDPSHVFHDFYGRS